MYKFIVINHKDEIQKIKEKIITIAQTLGDSREFSERYIDLSDTSALVKHYDKIIGFSLARNSISPEIRGVMFFATRVLPEYQNKKIGNTLVYSLLKKSIKLQGLDLFHPFYFVTGTAHPIVYSLFHKKLNIVPSLKNNSRITELYKKIADNFADTFFPELSFDAENFVLKGAFLDSAESFDSHKIPWSKDNEVNQFLESRLNLTKQLGHMLVIVAKVPKLWEIKEGLFG